MLRRQSQNYIFLSVILDFSATIGALWLAQIIRNNSNLGKTLGEPSRVPIPLFIVAVVAWVTVFSLMSVYDPQRNYRTFQELQQVVISSLILLLVLAGALYFSYRDISRLQTIYFFVLYISILMGWRVLFRLLLFLFHRQPYPHRRVVIIGGNGVLEDIAYTLLEHRWTGLELVGYINDHHSGEIAGKPVLGKIKDAKRIIEMQAVDEVIMSLPHHEYERLNNLVVELQTLPLGVHVIPDYFNLALYRATVENFGSLPLIHLRAPALTPYQRLVKRVFDMVIGSILLAVMSPIMLIAALVIKLDSRGTVIFKQQRVGENGRLFLMYKFRSMEMDAPQQEKTVVQHNEDGKIIHKAPHDPRVTRIGHFIRQTSLDELPQLFNVLKGEMSLVGPRPEMPWLVDKYEPWQRKRFAVPQGMTGWWQIHSRANQPMYLHPEEDLYYIQNYSLLLDIVIMWKTLGAVIRRQGAF